MGIQVDNDLTVTHHNGPPPPPAPPAGWRWREDGPGILSRTTIERNDDPDSSVGLNERGNIFVHGRIAKAKISPAVRGVRSATVISADLVNAIAFLRSVAT